MCRTVILECLNSGVCTLLRFLSLNRAEHEERPFKRRLDEVLSNIKLREAAKCLSTGTVAFLMSKQTEVDPIQASDK